MYEMRPVPNKPGTTVIWHVAAKQASAALCGQELGDDADPAQADQARHCASCMAFFARLVTTVTP